MIDRRDFLLAGLVLATRVIPKSERILRLVESDVVEPAGDNFVMQQMLLLQILGCVQNRERRFVTGSEVADENAKALAEAIGQIPDTHGWRIGLYFAGDPDGDGVREFCQFLRRGGFSIELVCT